MVDILYVVGKNKSDWRNNELRYSLRSIAKYGKNVRRVFIAGFAPYWINTDEVTVIPVHDDTNCKHYNILRCIEEAVATGQLTERFLYSSDDHFYTKPVDFDKYPLYWRGVELPTERKQPYEWYNSTLVSTGECLSAMGMSTHHYAWHGNTWYNTRLFLQPRMVLLRRLAQTMTDACEPTCLMLNYWQTVEPDTLPKIVERKDGKVLQADTLEEVIRKAKAKEVISSTDAAGNALRLWLQREFPNTCKYERQD